MRGKVIRTEALWGDKKVMIMNVGIDLVSCRGEARGESLCTGGGSGACPTGRVFRLDCVYLLYGGGAACFNFPYF